MTRKFLIAACIPALLALSGCKNMNPAGGTSAVTASGGAVASAPSTAVTVNDAAGVTEATVCGAFGAYYAAKGSYQPTGILLTAQESLATFCSGSPIVGSTPTATLVNLALDAAKLVASHTLGL